MFMEFPLTAPSFDESEILHICSCLESKWVTQGPKVKEFEEAFAERHRVTHALATTSCTAALHLATLALGLGPGDEVIVPAFTWVTSANCAEYVGAKAVFADVDPNTFNLDVEAFEDAVTERTRAVVAVHLFGLAAQMDRILEIAEENFLAVIEDAACAVGSTFEGRPVGGLGTFGCFSFHPRKVITTGEGGMVTTDDDESAKLVASLRTHGCSPPGPNDDPTRPYFMGAFDILGFNLRMPDILASVGIAQMAKLDGLLAERAECAAYYDNVLSEIEELVLPAAPEKCGHTYQSYVVRVRNRNTESRNGIMDFLQANGIQTRPGTHAVHRLGYYRDKYGIRAEQFPNACLGEDTTITLPIFPGMTRADQDTVAEVLKQAVRR
jgi:perosamine synthetase